MGCDYYIVKILKVVTENKNEFEIELNRERGYFSEENADDIDSDDTVSSCDNFFENFYKRYGHYLNVKYEPRILYIDNKWKNEMIKEKYEEMVNDTIGDQKIFKVTKEELRFFR